MPTRPPHQDAHPIRKRVHEIIFEADTPLGKAFDVALLFAIILSVLAVMLDSVSEYKENFGEILQTLEWIFTILFTLEYVMRLMAVGRPMKYAKSFFGIIDLMAILPTYLSLFIVGSQSLLVIRSLRLLRVFRVFKIGRYLIEANVLLIAVKHSAPKIIVFLGTVLSLALIMGTMIYLVEGEENGFTSIPRAMYWAIVTMTTVGYGDLTPNTALGQTLASVVMVLGYSIIAIPTGIVSVELAKSDKARVSTQACPECSKEGHDPDAQFCKYCGEKL